MHPRSLVPAAALIVLAPLFAQAPDVGPPSPDTPARPLIAAPPLEESAPPIPIPKSPDPSLTALENAVLAAHDAVILATESRDLDHLAELLAPTNRGAMVADGHMTLTRDDVLAAREREFAGLRHLHYDYAHRHVTLLSATSALVVGEGTATATAHDGTRIEQPFAHTLVFVVQDGQWRIAHWHSSTPSVRLAP